MLNRLTGPLSLEQEHPVLVVPVNTKGVMGAGFALAFRKKYPALYAEYQTLCENKVLKPGKCYLSGLSQIVRDFPYVVFAVTKDHWKDPSKPEWVYSCYVELDKIVKDLEGPVSVPALGAGKGGIPLENSFKMAVPLSNSTQKYNWYDGLNTTP